MDHLRLARTRIPAVCKSAPPMHRRVAHHVSRVVLYRLVSSQPIEGDVHGEVELQIAVVVRKGKRELLGLNDAQASSEGEVHRDPGAVAGVANVIRVLCELAGLVH